MPQLVLLAAIGAGAYVGYRWLKHAVEAVASEARAAEVAAREKRGAMQAKDLGTLEYDPATGQYRPARRG